MPRRSVVPKSIELSAFVERLESKNTVPVYRGRDPKRIRPLLERIAQVWEQYPDQRLGQIIAHAAGKLHPQGSCDPFYHEDEALVAEIESQHKGLDKRRRKV